jgi:hypothetical protein
MGDTGNRVRDGFATVPHALHPASCILVAALNLHDGRRATILSLSQHWPAVYETMAARPCDTFFDGIFRMGKMNCQRGSATFTCRREGV